MCSCPFSRALSPQPERSFHVVIWSLAELLAAASAGRQAGRGRRGPATRLMQRGSCGCHRCALISLFVLVAAERSTFLRAKSSLFGCHRCALIPLFMLVTAERSTFLRANSSPELVTSRALHPLGPTHRRHMYVDVFKAMIRTMQKMGPCSSGSRCFCGCHLCAIISLFVLVVAERCIFLRANSSEGLPCWTLISHPVAPGMHP